MEHFEREISEKSVFNCPIFELAVRTVELEDHSIVDRAIIRHYGGVCLVALEGDDLLMVKQYRAGLKQEILELPAGKREKDEDPILCGLRELEEETGRKANHLIFLCDTAPIPPYCQEIVKIYEAVDLTPSQLHLDDDEFLTVCKIPFKDALNMVLTGQIIDGKTQIGILQYAIKHNLL